MTQHQDQPDSREGASYAELIQQGIDARRKSPPAAIPPFIEFAKRKVVALRAEADALEASVIEFEATTPTDPGSDKLGEGNV
jgi:hypothetical protein